MNEFNPGDGWREIPDIVPTTADILTLMSEGTGDRYWVRVEPVPPLPTEPGTVIGIGDWRLVRLAPYEPGLPGTWEMLPIPKAVQSSVEDAGARMQCVYGDEWVRAEAEQHGGFEVLADPRQPGSATYTSEQLNAVLDGAKRGTAKAVIDRVRGTSLMQLMLAANPRNGDAFDAIAREFGVES